MLLAGCVAIGIASGVAVALRPASIERRGAKRSEREALSAPGPAATAQPQALPVASEVPPASPPAVGPVWAAYREAVAQQPAVPTPAEPANPFRSVPSAASPENAAGQSPAGEVSSQLEPAAGGVPREGAGGERAIAPMALPSDGVASDQTPPATGQTALPDGAQPKTPPPSPDNPSAAQGAASSEVRRLEGDEGISLSIQNTDIRTVLEMISRETGLNIVASKNVQGTVTANLHGVSVETALAAILKSTGYVAVREGDILYVALPTDLAQMHQAQDRIATRIYRPNYARAAELQALFTPLLSSDGKITVSTPAQTDIPSDQTKTGGNAFAGLDTVIVRDYESVLVQLDEIFAEVDTKPRQVAIEAMILSVKLSDQYKFGVNFEVLRDRANVRLISGTPPNGLGDIAVGQGGLHFGFLDSSLALFLDALEKVGDTNVIAAPRLVCLNKQRAEIQIGEELGYVSTTVTESSSTQTINFLDVGTLLRIRPYIGNDGLIRLEVHPELSTGSVDVQQGLSLPQKAVTQVTTNVLCPDGCTVVIGGLIREDLTTNTNQLPLLGNVPYVGWLFRQTSQTVDRNEIIVLITPRIISDPLMCEEGAKYGNQFTQRQKTYFDKMSPLGKRNLGQHHLRLARAAYHAGDFATAMKQVNLAIHYDPQSREAVVLRNDILAAGGFEVESIHDYLKDGLAPWPGGRRDYSRQGFPWKEFEGFGPPEPTSTDDPGTPGRIRTVHPPPPLQPPSTLPSGPTLPRGPVQPPGSKTPGPAPAPAPRAEPLPVAPPIRPSANP
jgi:type IV pilus assembly protein PilQ